MEVFTSQQSAAADPQFGQDWGGGGVRGKLVLVSFPCPRELGSWLHGLSSEVWAWLGDLMPSSRLGFGWFGLA